MTSIHRTDNPSVSTHRGGLAGWICLLLACLAATCWLIGDPYWLSLPLHLGAIAIGADALRRGQVHHVGVQLGFNMALFTLLIWIGWKLWPLVVAM